MTGALVIAFLVWGFTDTDGLAAASTLALNWVPGISGWVFVLLSSVFVVYVLWLAIGRFGNIPLGKDGEGPEFKTGSWISMMFACGMGIGLMFYGVAEPLYHYISPPPSTVDGQTVEAVETAMATSVFHWTLHPWAMYAVVGIAIAYSTFRLGRKNLLSEAFVSLFGRKAVRRHRRQNHQHPRHLCHPLRLGSVPGPGCAADRQRPAVQRRRRRSRHAAAGDHHRRADVLLRRLGGSGLEKGIQFLSNTNMILAVVLAVVVFVVGPTLFILNLIPSALGSYIQQLPKWRPAPKPQEMTPCAPGSPAGQCSTGSGGCPGPRS